MCLHSHVGSKIKRIMGGGATQARLYWQKNRTWDHLEHTVAWEGKADIFQYKARSPGGIQGPAIPAVNRTMGRRACGSSVVNPIFGRSYWERKVWTSPSIILTK